MARRWQGRFLAHYESKEPTYRHLAGYEAAHSEYHRVVKGFPNQVAELPKIAVAMGALVQLVDFDMDAKDDGVLGPALVRAGVAGTGHTPLPVEDYIQEQLRKKPSNQSFRTTARGLRELFRLLSLIDDSDARVQVTELGHQAAAFAGSPMTADQTDFWRRVISNMICQGSNGEASHPYQMMLRLVARRPGITRAKCALALEARNDSLEELARIVALAGLDEDEIIRQIGVTQANWDNAKKVLPKFAEQLGDVLRNGHSLTLAPSLGGAYASPDRVPGEPLAMAAQVPRAYLPAGGAPIRAPRSSREVTRETIGVAGTVEGFDEVTIPPEIDPAAAQAAVRQRLDRLRRHNLIVRALAARLSEAGARLYEDPFDVLAVVDELGILGEVKSLDGTPRDERDRVMEALAQLLYYEAFVTVSVVGEAAIHKIACFEAPITQAHQDWLNRAQIGSLWLLGDGRFGGDALAVRVLSDYLDELR